MWREFNYKMLKYIDENYTGVVIAPMTVYVRQYYDEIIGELVNDGVMVEHFILCAAKQTIIDRLIARGDVEDGWAARHIDTCIAAFETDMPGEKIITDNMSIKEEAEEIVKML